MNTLSASNNETILGILILLFLFYACDLEGKSPRISIGAGKLEWRAYCDRDLRFLIHYPPEMELRVKRPQITAAGKFNLLEWRVPRSEWSIILHLHDPTTEKKTRPLRKWLEDWGGNLEEITLADNTPAVLRTSLFEAIFEKSVFFKNSSDGVVEIRLVVPSIVDWTGPVDKVEPQYRNQEKTFDRMIQSIRAGACP